MVVDPHDDFSRWSEISATLRDRAPSLHLAILQRFGLTDRWAAIEARWAAILLDDIAAGNLERVMQYGDACAQERSRRSRGEDPHANLSAVTTDFRQQLHHAVAGQRPTGPAEPPQLGFVEHMTPRGPAPEKPHVNQKQTATASSNRAVRDALAAMAWPVERYAGFCAALATQPSAVVAAEFGVVEEAFNGVHKAWRNKLGSDPTLQATYDVAYWQLQQGS